jgi:hypothetical protein
MRSMLLIAVRSAVVCTLLSFAVASMAQTTIHVGPGQPYTTIQSGIDAANTGDTVLVAPGTYNENIDFKGKDITVTSAGGAAQTIIDGGSNGPAISFKSGETSASTISGFTIQHGGMFGWLATYSAYGIGNIYLVSSSPTIINNTITLSNCWGIEAYYSAPLIQNNTISATQDPNGNCSFGGGAAIIVWGGINNQYNGTGVYSGLIVGNTIENNVESGLEDAGGNGGAGIAVWGGSPIIQNNIIRNNSSPGGSGGAINFVNSEGTVIVQNLIYGNSAGCGGGAIATDGHGLYVINNTIVDNVGVDEHGFSECASIAQIYPDPFTYGTDNPSDIFINNIISGSTPYPAVNCSWFLPPSEEIQPTFQNNILYNAGGPFFGSFCVDVSGKYNNIVTDPQFVDPSNHDYHLKSTSPAIDSGQNSILQNFMTMTGLSFAKDFDGKPRVQDAKANGCAIDIGAYEYPGALSNCNVFETLTSSLNPATAGQSVTFTAQLSSFLGTPTGAIQFMDGGNLLSTQTVSATGSATFTTSTLTVGSHTIIANYQPTGSFGANSASLTQVINGNPTTTALTCNPNPIAVYGTAQLTAAVTSTSGTPTGSISFTDNGASLASTNLLNGTTSLTYTGLTAGTHTITATYTPTGSFAASSATCSETVNALPTTSALTVAPNPSTYGSPVTLTVSVSPVSLPAQSSPAGIVTFYNGTSAIGTATLAGGVATLTYSSLPGGINSLSCMYSGSPVYATSNCNPVSALVTPAASSISLAGTPNPGNLNQPVNFTATVSSQASSAQVGNGNVSFYDGSNLLGSSSLTATGTGSLTASFALVGIHPITAVYQGNANYSSSTSAVLNETINAGDFSIAVKPGAASVYTGKAASVQLGITPLQGFNQPLALTCSGLPVNATCTFSPTSLPQGQGAANLVIQTTAPHRAATARVSGAAAILGALILLLLPGWRRRRGILLGLSLLLLAVGVPLAITGCASTNPITGGTPPGIYQVSVAASTTGTGTTITHSSVVTLSVKSLF